MCFDSSPDKYITASVVPLHIHITHWVIVYIVLDADSLVFTVTGRLSSLAAILIRLVCVLFQKSNSIQGNKTSL